MSFLGPSSYHTTTHWDTIYRQFMSPQNVAVLRQRLARMGYPNVRWNEMYPYAVEVYNSKLSNGYDPSRCNMRQSISDLNNEFIEYVAPIIELWNCALNTYIIDQMYPGCRQIDQPTSDSCKGTELMFNNRFP